MTESSSSEARFAKVLHRLEREFLEVRRNFFSEGGAAALGEALRNPAVRRYALWCLTAIPEVERRQYLPILVEQCGVSHADIDAARDALFSLNRFWLIANIEREVVRVLGSLDANDEEYRRFAELYREIDPELLDVHLRRCAGHPDPNVVEVANDFRVLK